MAASRRTLLQAAAAAFGVAATGVARARAAEDGPITIGHIVPTSGPLKGIAEPSVVAADLAIADINASGGLNGRPFRILRYDTASDPRQAGIAARKLIEDDKVLAIVGPFSSSEAAVGLVIAGRAQTPMMLPAASQPHLLDGHDFVWHLSPDEGAALRRLFTSMQRKNVAPHRGAIFYVSDEGVSNDAGLHTYPPIFDAFGVAHPAPVAFQYKSFDVSPQVAKILPYAPDVVAIAAVPEQAAQVVHELRRQKSTARVIGSQLFADPLNVELFGADGNGTLFVSLFYKQSSPQAAAFDAAFVAENARRGIHRAGVFHTDAITYDEFHILRLAMQRGGVTGNPARLAAERVAIRNAMQGLTYDGVLGKNICFNGPEGAIPSYVIELKDQAWSLFDFWPADHCG